MANRGLTRVTMSFLLGIVVSEYKMPWLIIVWMAGLSLWVFAGGFQKNLKMGKGQSFQKIWQNDITFVRKSKKQKYSAVIWLLLCLAASFLGYYRYEKQQNYFKTVEEYISNSSTVCVEGTIYKKEEKNWSIVYYLKDSYIMEESGSQYGGQILIYLDTDEYSIGDTIRVKGNCENFERARNQGNFDGWHYYHCKNILFQVKAKSVELLEKEHIPWKEYLYGLRKEIQQVYMSQMPEKQAGVLSVMTVGDKGLMDEEVKKLYQQSGISHVLAISGLHVSILGMGVYRFLRKWRFSYWSSGMVAGLLVLCFGQISGMELSTRRAVMMFVIMLFGNAMGMAYDSVTALSFSALIQLWENPFSLWYAGFQFSYSAVLAVVVAAKILRRDGEEERKTSDTKENMLKSRLRKGKKLLLDTIFTSSCIQLVTLPLTVYYYYEFPLYSILINGLLLPMMGVLLASGILGGMMGAAVNGLGITGVGNVVISFGEGVVWLLLWPARLLLVWNEWLCNLFGKLPGALWITGQPKLWMMLFYYSVLIVALGIIHRMKRIDEKEQQKSVRRKRKKLLAIVFALLIALLIIRPKKEFRIHFLDVGQGDGICIQNTDGTTFFIDGGSTSESNVGEYRILSFLKYHGIGHVDGWFVSHADKDHTSGLLEIWESGYRIDCLFLAEKIAKDEAWEELCVMAQMYETEIVYLEQGDAICSEELQFTCLAPWVYDTDRNEASLVLYMKYQEMAGMFAGDISEIQEEALIKEYPELSVDVYKANHHGSNGSSSEKWLAALNPSLTVISCSEDNNYGHPGEEAVERMKAIGSRIFYTMESGQITIEYEKRRICIKEKIKTL